MSVHALILVQGGRLTLAGVSSRVKGQLDRTETTADTLGKENVFVSTSSSDRRDGQNQSCRLFDLGQTSAPWVPLLL
jgi:hypothetical protein